MRKFKSLSYCAQAFQIFKDKDSLVDVAIDLDQETDTILNNYRYYLRLVRMKNLVTMHDELKNDFSLLSCHWRFSSHINIETKCSVPDYFGFLPLFLLHTIISISRIHLKAPLS
jgi:hypothetical protein